ncbi:MAG: hypothetical protein Q8S20_08095 [Sulfuritalea sp.]|nr:hypothetical protein [Sulfuritalea sp.]
MTSRGGKRKGAGRPKGSGKAARASAPAPAPGSAPEAPQAIYEDAESYLAAVVEGREPPDALRIAAAKAVMPFQKRKQRVPLAAVRTAKAQGIADEMTAATDLNARFKSRVVELAAARKKGA